MQIIAIPMGATEELVQQRLHAGFPDIPEQAMTDHTKV